MKAAAGTFEQIAAAADLVALLLAALACLSTRRVAAGWALGVTSALWPPANNGVFEGPVILSFDRTHGMTAADLFAVGGLLLAGWTLWTARPAARRTGRLTGLCGLALAGMLAAYTFQN